MTDGKAELLWPEKEIESLRQRVAELEGAIGLERIAHHHELAALKQGRNALAEFNEHWQEADEDDPIERLRFFCSLAMRGQDWLDVEPFFDALKAQPLYLHPAPSETCFSASDMADAQAKAFREGSAIHEGWQLVPIEPTEKMVNAVTDDFHGDRFLTISIYKAMLAAAPKP